MSSIHCQYLENPQWELGNSKPIDFESEIRIHKIYIPDHVSAIPFYFGLLDDSEKKRAKNYLQAKDGQRFIIARGILKVLASQYLGIAALEVVIKVGANKKPFISVTSSTQLDYNISHSGNWILIAFGYGNIGIDVEEIQSSFNYESLLPVCFSQVEQECIHDYANPRVMFYRLWTRKESLVKATSKGLDDHLPLLTCLDGEWELLERFGHGLFWQTKSFTLDDHHVASISFSDSKKNILFIEQDIRI